MNQSEIAWEDAGRFSFKGFFGDIPVYRAVPKHRVFIPEAFEHLISQQRLFHFDAKEVPQVLTQRSCGVDACCSKWTCLNESWPNCPALFLREHLVGGLRAYSSSAEVGAKGGKNGLSVKPMWFS